MAIRIPKRIFGVDVNDKTLEEALKDSSSEPQEPVQKPRGLILPGNFDGNQYVQIPNTTLVIAKAETHKGKNWNDTHNALGGEGLFMPTPAIFLKYFASLKDSASGKTNLYDGRGQLITAVEAQDLWKYASSGHRGGCWTWLDAYFEKDSQEKMWVKTDHRASNGRNGGLTNRRISLDVPVDEEGFVKLKFTSLGMPKEKSEANGYQAGKNIYFYPPTNESVARFGALSDWADLSCGGDPSDGGVGLGVFACAEGTPTKKSGGSK
ncbi:MAG: hypothetical protein Q7R96_02585 [Nanoarchaeota archaeon]|nr:hypothetical protein [Nanoarchaeota archaeon]